MKKRTLILPLLLLALLAVVATHRSAARPIPGQKAPPAEPARTPELVKLAPTVAWIDTSPVAAPAPPAGTSDQGAALGHARLADRINLYVSSSLAADPATARAAADSLRRDSGPSRDLVEERLRRSTSPREAQILNNLLGALK